MSRALWSVAVGGVSLAMGLSAAGSAAPTETVKNWDWLVPLASPMPPAKPPLGENHVPGSTQTFTNAQLRDLKHAVDWFPGEHPAMPAIVAEGHDSANACGFCHLPNGNGRPENSALAGLPADYIKRQVAAFADNSRQSAVPNALPVQLMAATAKGISARELDEAAAYFSKLTYVSYVKVVETAKAGFKAGSFIYVLQPDAEQPLGERIIEAPVDIEGFERRDPHTQFIAYVPKGSVAAGRKVAETGGPSGQPCASCHGEGLTGGIAPALAGRPPTLIVRELAFFHEGVRRNPEAAPMRSIAGQLDTQQMIAVAAYAATLKP